MHQSGSLARTKNNLICLDKLKVEGQDQLKLKSQDKLKLKGQDNNFFFLSRLAEANFFELTGYPLTLNWKLTFAMWCGPLDVPRAMVPPGCSGEKQLGPQYMADPSSPSL